MKREFSTPKPPSGARTPSQDKRPVTDLGALVPKQQAVTTSHMSFRDLSRITNPSLPSPQSPRPMALSSRDNQRVKHELEMKHDALMIVEQKAPNVWKVTNESSNVNRYLNSDMRQEALRTLPLAFPPVRFRRGETIDEYIESVTKPWEEARRMSSMPLVSRRMSASGRAMSAVMDEIVLSAQHMKNEQLRMRHDHIASQLWRQTHATKAELISADETSKSLLTPLLDSATQAAIHTEDEMIAAVASSCKEGVTATGRGLVVPYQYFASLVLNVTNAVDNTFFSFFQSAQDEDMAHHQAESDVATANLTQLMNSSVRKSGKVNEDAAAVMTRRTVQLPVAGHPSRHSLVAVQTAINVAVLWRMLEQVKSIVPGMETALKLFEDLLPLLYVDFQQVRSLMPSVACLAEQIRQLCSIPLTCVELQRSEANEAQFRQDVDYLRKAMENWSFTIWRNYNNIERRRAKHMESLYAWFDRVQSRRSLAIFFYEWRFYVLHERKTAAVKTMRDKFDGFLRKARHAAAESIPMSSNRAMAANQARFLAQRLAASSTHTKNRQQQSQPGSQRERSASPRSPTSPKSPGKKLKVQNATANGEGESLQTAKRNSPNESDEDDDGGADGGHDEENSPSDSNIEVFDEVMSKLQSVEDVSGYLREFIAIQKQHIEKLERERRHTSDQLKKSQEETLKLLEEKLALNNTIQDRDLKIREQIRQILRLKSKVRLHRHKNWRAASMRIIADTLRVSSATSEKADRDKVEADLASQPGSRRTFAGGNIPTPLEDVLVDAEDADDGGQETETERENPELADNSRKPSEQQRIFGRMAPLVLDAPSQLPDALIIIKDWANNCLEDLQALDGVGGASLSSRFSSMTYEVRDGLIFSRLLFYLALPRYEEPRRNEELDDVSPDFNVNRQRLLSLNGVQLHSPFPTYDDCFGDLLRFPPVKRMNILLNFASDLIAGTSRLSSEQVEALNALSSVAAQISEEEQQRSGETPFGNNISRKSSMSKRSRVFMELEDYSKKNRRGSTAFGEDFSASFPATSELLSQYVDPLLLCEGSKSAIVTFLSILYVRFSHPFNHKANETVVREVDLMKALLRDPLTALGSSSATPSQSNIGDGTISRKMSSLKLLAATPSTATTTTNDNNKLEEMLNTMEDEEKSPWQVFLERCKPFFSSSTHAFVLEGNFWSSMSIESADMLEVFAAMTNALRRSLDTHRWHVTMMCLTPMISSFGATRGCFSGMLASTSLYLYQRSCNAENVIIDPELVFSLLSQRKELLPRVNSGSHTQRGSTPPSPQSSSLPAAVVDGPQSSASKTERAVSPTSKDLALSSAGSDNNGFDDQFNQHPLYTAVQRVLTVFMDDLARAFLSRSGINATLLMPSMTLTSWRMLWMDAGICPEKLSLETLTFIFSEACHASSAVTRSRNRAFSVSSSEGGDQTSSSASPVTNLLQEMSFDEFCAACLRVAHYRYAPVTLVNNNASSYSAVSPTNTIGTPHTEDLLFGSSINPPPLPMFGVASTSHSRVPSANPHTKKRVVVPLHDAFSKLIAEVLVPLYPPNSPPIALQQLKQGVHISDLLRRKNADLLAVFQAYGKVYLGISAMEREDALRIVKDAGLATAELSYQVVAELFADCCIKRTSGDVAMMNVMDPYHVDGLTSQQRQGSSIFGGPHHSATSFLISAASPPSGGNSVGSVALPLGSAPRQHQNQIQQATMDRQLLDFPAFVDFLIVLMLYKYPNPFVPMHARLDSFLERCIIAPLRFRVEQAARARARRKQTTVGLSSGNDRDISTASSNRK